MNADLQIFIGMLAVYGIPFLGYRFYKYRKARLEQTQHPEQPKPTTPALRYQEATDTLDEIQKKRKRIEELNRFISNVRVSGSCAEYDERADRVEISYRDENDTVRSLSAHVGGKSELFVQFAVQERDTLITSLQSDFEKLAGRAGQNGGQNEDKTDRGGELIRQMIEDAGL